MTFIQIVLLGFCTIVCVGFLVAGGWVSVRNWIKSKAAAKVASANAAEAAIQARIDAALAVAAKDKADGTTVDGTVNTAAAQSVK